jgi:hypothetical protein
MVVADTSNVALVGYEDYELSGESSECTLDNKRDLVERV